MPDNAFAVKTIVSSNLARTIAENYNVESIDVLTGFKFIGELIKLYHDTGKKCFMFGFEESYGFLIGTHARDKDAVSASMLIAELYAWYKSRGMNMYSGLLELFEKYGYVKEETDSIVLKGKEGQDKIAQAMETLRNMELNKVGNMDVRIFSDYERQVRKDLKTNETTRIQLPKSNVLHYTLDSGFWFCVRPSGTEPKMKIYYGVSSYSLAEAQTELKILKKNVKDVINPLLVV